MTDEELLEVALAKFRKAPKATWQQQRAAMIPHLRAMIAQEILEEATLANWNWVFVNGLNRAAQIAKGTTMSEATHLLHGDHPRAWCLCGVNFDFPTRYEQYQDHLYFVREQQTRAMIAQEILDQQTGSTSTNGRIRDNALHRAAQIAKGPQQ